VDASLFYGFLPGTAARGQMSLALPRLPRRHHRTEEAGYHLLDRAHHRATVFLDDEDGVACLRLRARCRSRSSLRLCRDGLREEHRAPAGRSLAFKHFRGNRAALRNSLRLMS
jgi:hypothetical protein